MALTRTAGRSGRPWHSRAALVDVAKALASHGGLVLELPSAPLAIAPLPLPSVVPLAVIARTGCSAESSAAGGQLLQLPEVCCMLHQSHCSTCCMPKRALMRRHIMFSLVAYVHEPQPLIPFRFEKRRFQSMCIRRGCVGKGKVWRCAQAGSPSDGAAQAESTATLEAYVARRVSGVGQKLVLP